MKAARPPGAQGDDLLPPLIFPTDKQKNNIVPINKTAIKILMHEDDIYNTSNSDSTMTKDGHNKDTLPVSELVLLYDQIKDFKKTRPPKGSEQCPAMTPRLDCTDVPYRKWAFSLLCNARCR